MRIRRLALVFFSTLLAFSVIRESAAEELYRPFVSVASSGETVSADAVEAKLKAAGITIVGRYSPYADGSAVIIGATTPELLKAASSHAYGGFGAVIRVAVTRNGDRTEVSYVDPLYLGQAYHIGDLSGVAATFEKVLGRGESFGAKGLSEGQLKEYHYMMFMPYFKDRKVIGRFDSHDEAVKKVAAALADKDSDMAAVWQVRIDEQQTLFGVRLHGGKWKAGMKGIMDKIDIGTPKATAALPWELLVSGAELVYLPGKFRIAIMFPDLTMNTFMKISDVPDNMDESAEKLGKKLGIH